MSTWGTWGLMGVNVLLFLVFQIGVEPWRRKRLVKGFEEKVMEALEREGPAAKQDSQVQAAEDGVVEEAIIAEFAAEGDPIAISDALVLDTTMVAKEEPAETVVVGLPVEFGAEPSLSSSSSPQTFKLIKERIEDLFSERQISLRQVDLTTVALEGAAAGVAFVGLLVLLLRPR